MCMVMYCTPDVDSGTGEFGCLRSHMIQASQIFVVTVPISTGHMVHIDDVDIDMKWDTSVNRASLSSV